jgi:hypothetical protein
MGELTGCNVRWKSHPYLGRGAGLKKRGVDGFGTERQLFVEIVSFISLSCASSAVVVTDCAVRMSTWAARVATFCSRLSTSAACFLS